MDTSKTPSIKFDLFVLGAGGTGSYFLKEVSRQIASSAEIKKQIHSMYIMDGDIVEEKNLERQCFVKDDIGRSKATVMSEVLNETFSLEWKAIPSYLLETDTLFNLFPSAMEKATKDTQKIYVPIIIGCVDNHGARLLCERFFEKVEHCIYFDSANEFTTGECVYAYKLLGKILGPCRSTYFPAIKTEDTRNRDDISCTELNNVAPQHIYTNMMAGLMLTSGFNNLIEGKMTPGVTYFNPQEYSSEYIAYQPKK